MKKQGFTLIELLVVIAIIAILAAILFPVFISARQKAWQTQCSSNLRQIGMAMTQYIDDNGGRYPMWVDFRAEGYRWFDAVQKYSKSKLLTRCPLYGNKDKSKPVTYWRNVYTDYWSNMSGVAPPLTTAIVFPRSTCLLMEGPPNPSEWTWWGPPFCRTPTDPSIDPDSDLIHLGRGNVLFCDGHIQTLDHNSWKSDRVGTSEGNPLFDLPNKGVLPTGNLARWADRNDGSHPWFRGD